MSIDLIKSIQHLFLFEHSKARLTMIEGKLQKEGKVIHVITQVYYDFSKLLRRLAVPKERNSPQGKEVKQEKLFPEARSFR